MRIDGEPGLLATLWHLEWNENSLTCAVYRTGGGLQLTIQSPTSVIITEPFDVRPRAVSRAEALRESLKRRGWTDGA